MHLLGIVKHQTILTMRKEPLSNMLNYKNQSWNGFVFKYRNELFTLRFTQVLNKDDCYYTSTKSLNDVPKRKWFIGKTYPIWTFQDPFITFLRLISQERANNTQLRKNKTKINWRMSFLFTDNFSELMSVICDVRSTS